MIIKPFLQELIKPFIPSQSKGSVTFPITSNISFRVLSSESYTDNGITKATTLGDKVQQINDVSGSNHIIQTTLANKATYVPICALTGKPAIRSVASLVVKMLAPNVSINSRNFSIYFIMRPTLTGDDSYGLFNFGSSVALSTPMTDITTGVIRSYQPLNSTASQFLYGNPLVCVVTGSASAINTYVNNNKQSLAAFDPATVNGGVILHRGVGYPHKGCDLYECGLFNSVLSDADVANIVTYAKNVYGVKTSFTNFFGTSGDSLTEGVPDTAALGIHHPLIVANTLGPTWKFANSSVSSLETNTLTTRCVYGLNLQVAGITGRKVFCYYGGTNDFGESDVTVATLQSRITSLVSQQASAGFNEIYIATIAARGDYVGVPDTLQHWSAAKETKRNTYNAWLRTQVGSLFTNVIDLDTVPETTDPANTTYFISDRVHFTQATRAAIAAKTLAVLGF